MNIYSQDVLVLLVEEILQQFLCSLSHYLQGFVIHPRHCRISSINSMAQLTFTKTSMDILIAKGLCVFSNMCGFENFWVIIVSNQGTLDAGLG